MLGLDSDPVRVVQAGEQAEYALDAAPPMPTGKLDAEAVPLAVRRPPEPLMKVIMPIVMVAAIGAMVVIMALSGRGVSPMMMVFPLMMVMGLLTMLNPPEKAGDIDESRRVYLRHLDALAARARENGAQQREHVEYFHPHPKALVNGVPAERVWERSQDHPRSLEVRVGTGMTRMSTPIDVPDPGSPEDLDPVCAVSLRRTIAAVSVVPQVPVVVQLEAFPAVTLTGPDARNVARSIITQLAFFHGPELVGLHITAEGCEWAKWLPHTKDPESAEFTVAVVEAGSPEAIAASHNCVIAVHDGETSLIQDDALHLVCDGELHALTAAGKEKLGLIDDFPNPAAEFIARNLAFYRRPDSTTGSGSGDLMELLGLEDVESLTPTTMWPGREGTRLKLMVPIGTEGPGKSGAPVYLDLKESAHGGMGPHGLCIGATGSGKSELLRSLVAALAATHSPNELNFVLVDFKGGATFLGCEGLPHTSAVITNLEDEAVLVERMFDAISGEMNRRQELLRAAGNFANASDYNAARKGARPDLEPLPALLIVVDEFSELLGQHPDFAELFVAVGRLGRSLGVHLLLASQRLEEGKLRGLDSHLSYRIGLRTFSAAESRQVLGVPDAYELPADPGSGYLKTASSEVTRFKAAYVSGPLMRRINSVAAPTGVRVFTGWEADVAPEMSADTSTTLLDAVVSAARAAADLRGEQARKIWLPPLPARVNLPDVCEPAGELAASIGLVDDPYRQRQDPFTCDLSAAGGHVAIAGGPQTGKSMAVRTLVAAMAATHTTRQIGFYIIDAGRGEHEALEALPHVAGVAERTDEERVRRIIDEVEGFIDNPRSDNPSTDNSPAHTVLVIDGWHSLTAPDSKLEDLRDALARIASDGPAAGVHLVLTTQRWNAIRPNVRDLVGTRFEFKLTEPMDSVIDRKAQEKLPTLPGRGITPQGQSMLVAFTSKEDIAHVAAQSADQAPVPRLKVLPRFVRLGETSGSILLGRGGRDLGPINLDAQHLVAIGEAGCGKSTLIETVFVQVAALPRESARIVLLDPRRAHLVHAQHTMVAAYGSSTDAMRTAIADTAATLTARLPGADVTAEQLASRSWWTGPDIYLLIDDFELLPPEHLQPLMPLLPHTQDIGLHIVVARKFGGAARALMSQFMSTLRDQQPDAVIFSGTREEGQLFGVRPIPLNPGRGILVRAGDNAGPIQIAAREETP